MRLQHAKVHVTCLLMPAIGLTIKWDIMMEIPTAVLSIVVAILIFRASMALTEVGIRVILVVETAHPVRICHRLSVETIFFAGVHLLFHRLREIKIEVGTWSELGNGSGHQADRSKI